jgi:hypothetical protein
MPERDLARAEPAGCLAGDDGPEGVVTCAIPAAYTVFLICVLCSYSQ